MEYIVYKTTNLINGKTYIGVHKTDNADVFDGYLGSGDMIQGAVAKYGKQNFVRETLIRGIEAEDTAYFAEGLLIKTNAQDKNSYNIRVGGRGRVRTKIQTEEERKNLAKTRSINNTGSKKYNDGNQEFHFHSSDKSNKASINTEFKLFLSQNPQFVAGRISIKLTKKTKNFGSKRYNNGTNEFLFHPKVQENVSVEFELFLSQNPQFNPGTISRKRTKVSPMIGGRKYHDGNEEYLFKSSNLNDKVLTNREFKEFLDQNPQFKSGRKYDNTKPSESMKGLKHYNDGATNFTFRPNNVDDRDNEFNEFLKLNPEFVQGQLSIVTKGYKVYSDGVAEYKFYQTSETFKEFLSNNPQYKPCRLYQFHLH